MDNLFEVMENGTVLFSAVELPRIHSLHLFWLEMIDDASCLSLRVGHIQNTCGWWVPQSTVKFCDWQVIINFVGFRP